MRRSPSQAMRLTRTFMSTDNSWKAQEYLMSAWRNSKRWWPIFRLSPKMSRSKPSTLPCWRKLSAKTRMLMLLRTHSSHKDAQHSSIMSTGTTRNLQTICTQVTGFHPPEVGLTPSTVFQHPQAFTRCHANLKTTTNTLRRSRQVKRLAWKSSWSAASAQRLPWSAKSTTWKKTRKATNVSFCSRKTLKRWPS